jgi:hypothetical protein
MAGDGRYRCDRVEDVEVTNDRGAVVGGLDLGGSDVFSSSIVRGGRVSYVTAGGQGRISCNIAQWFAQRGSRSLILISL